MVLLVLAALLYKQNKSLTKQVNDSKANITAYQGIVSKSYNSNNVLKLDIEDLRDYNDKLLNKLDSIRAKLKIKASDVSTVAGINQHIDTTASVPIQPKIVLVKDSCRLDKVIDFNK